MYTIQSHNSVVDKVARRRIVDVTFTNGEATFVKSFSFGVADDLATIKRIVKKYLDELNFVPEELTDFTLEEAPAPVEPTQDEKDRLSWQSDWRDLQTVTKLKEHGVEVLTETQLATLRTKVKNNFKKSYQDLV
jgi:hypothetical protein